MPAEYVMGFPTQDHMAEAAGVKSAEVASVMRANDQLPPLPPPAFEHRLGGRIVYPVEAVEAYRLRCEQWRADAPARNAARKAAREARSAAEREAEMKRIEQNQMLLKSDLAAREQYDRDKAEWIEQQKKAWGG